MFATKVVASRTPIQIRDKLALISTLLKPPREAHVTRWPVNSLLSSSDANASPTQQPSADCKIYVLATNGYTPAYFSRYTTRLIVFESARETKKRPKLLLTRFGLPMWLVFTPTQYALAPPENGLNLSFAPDLSFSLCNGSAHTTHVVSSFLSYWSHISSSCLVELSNQGGRNTKKKKKKKKKKKNNSSYELLAQQASSACYNSCLVIAIQSRDMALSFVASSRLLIFDLISMCFYNTIS
ncbi:MAG: hypothetical protein P3M73_00280 [Candidatus Hodgkinia cicadicola]|nr:MAG: hypothetical protein P3M73_00280 [Candidatus Hodgkinia cicadicola]